MKQQVARKELLGHAVTGVGQNLIFALWGNMMLFFTDGMMIPIGAAGMIVALTRIWDGINDPMMGMIADRTRSRWGRYRPWLLWMTVPVGVLIVLSFTAPNLPVGGRIAYAAIIYVLTSMAYTSIDVPYWSLPAAMTTDSGQRTKIYSLSRTMGVLAVLVVSILVPPLVSAVGGTTASGTVNYAKGFPPIAVAVALLGIACSLTGFFLVREHIAPAAQQPVKLSESLTVITHNKPLLLILIASILSSSLFNTRTGLGSYYAAVNLGDYGLASLLTVVALPGMVLGMVLTPALAKRVGKKTLFIGVCLFGLVMNVILFFVGYQNLLVFGVISAIGSLSMGVTPILTSSMIADTIEYAEWKTGQRREGLICSTQTLVAKFATAISGLLISLVLTVAGYVVGSAAQTQQVYAMFHFAYTLLVSIGCLLAILPMLAYPLTEKRHDEIVAELAARSAQKEAVAE